MFTICDIHSNASNSVDFMLSDAFCLEGIEANFQQETYFGDEERLFFEALWATSDEFDDVLRKLAD